MRYKKILVEATVSQMTSMRRSLWRIWLLFGSRLFLDNSNATYGRLKGKIAELDALQADMDFESNSVPPYLQPDKWSCCTKWSCPGKPAAGMPVARLTSFCSH